MILLGRFAWGVWAEVPARWWCPGPRQRFDARRTRRLQHGHEQQPVPVPGPPDPAADATRTVSSERRLRILVDLRRGDVTTARLCEVSRRILGVTGAAIVLYTDEIPLGSACTSSAVAEVVENLQHALGEGPCLDAYRHDRPVLEPDLANPVAARWPAFTGPALDAGVRAIFAFPVGVGSARLGALSLCVDRPGTLTNDQHADALVMATVVAESLLAMQAGGPPGALTAEIEAGSNLHYVVHQAAGMVSAQLEVSVGEALVRLRAHSYGAERPLAAVATDVVGRRLRFGDDAR